MKTRITILLLSLVACTKDTILIDQIPFDVKAIVNFTNDCQDVYGQMISETGVWVYSGSHSMYSDNDFATMSVEQNPNGIECGNKVIFFDGLNAWVWQSAPYSSYSRRISFEGRSELYLSGYGEYSFSPPALTYHMSYPPLFDDFASFLMAAENGSKIDIYQCNADSKTGTRIGSTNTLASPLLPRRMFKANGLWILTTQNYINPITPGVHYVLTSSNLTTWQGPYYFDDLSGQETIEEVTGSGGTFVANIVDYETEPHQYSFRLSSDAGASWSILGDGMNFIYAQVIDAQTIFAIVASSDGDRGTISKLYKSTDTGATWDTEALEFYGDRIHFYDANNGLAMSEGTLQITHDGGKTWKLIFTTPYGIP